MGDTTIGRTGEHSIWFCDDYEGTKRKHLSRLLCLCCMAHEGETFEMLADRCNTEDLETAIYSAYN